MSLAWLTSGLLLSVLLAGKVSFSLAMCRAVLRAAFLVFVRPVSLDAELVLTLQVVVVVLVI